MRIRKVKFKDETVTLFIEEKIGKTEKETTFKCSEKAHPDFDSALGALVPIVRKILEISDSTWIGCLRVSGVTWSESEESGVEGAVISGKVELDAADAPFCFNTPHLPFEQYSEGGEAGLMPPEGIEALEVLRSEAQAYMTGQKRAQLELTGTDA
jgi:hypothetical protein